MVLSDLKAKRKGLRQAFTLNLKKIEKIGQLPITTFGGITEGGKRDEQLFSEDFEEAETYRDRYLENCFKIENRLQENAGPSEAEKGNSNYQR
ncbi:hypothetical protein TNCV_818591 [Trichonephila clavipes]|nr:hypothetical protein TNCV_818591 [Trichonephila clavipes]